jgi:hypothetical protein
VGKVRARGKGKHTMSTNYTDEEERRADDLRDFIRELFEGQQ